jgi:hypothetical protein
MPTEIIELSLQALVEKVGDPSELVYQRLYLKAPDLESLFARDSSGTKAATLQ